MKRVIIAGLFTASVLSSFKADAQLGNLVKKMAKKNEATTASESNNNSKKKGSLYGIIMNGKAFDYTFGPSEVFSIEDKGYPYVDKETNEQKMTTQLLVQNERRSFFETFRREVIKDEFYFDDNGNNTYMRKVDPKTILVFKMDNNKKIEDQTIDDVIFSILLTSDKDLVGGVESDKKNSAGYKLAQENILKCFALIKNKDAADDEKKAEQWEKSFADVLLPEVAKEQPADAKKKAPAAVKAAADKYCKGQELLYYYFGVRPGLDLVNGWRIVKEPRKNNAGVIERIITKRSRTIVAVTKTASGKHSFNYFELTENVVPGVMDGSKFDGNYYIDSYSPFGIAKANAMANKGK